MELQIPELNSIRSSIDDLYKIISRLADTGKIKKTVGMQDIAYMEGISLTNLRTKERYLLPRFGESGYPTGAVRWDLDEYLEWRKIPAEEREQSWKQHLLEEMRRERDRKKS